MKYESSASSVTVLMSIPQGPRINGRVKEFSNHDGSPETVHPGKPHDWREMLHYGERGTGFAECWCGAMGVPYEKQP